VRVGPATLAAALVAALPVAGCSDDATLTRSANQGGSVVIAEAEPPDSLDPALASNAAARRTAWLAYTPPLTYRRVEGQAGTELIPALLEDMPETSDDGRTYTLELTRGLRYSNGQVLRASDLERAIERSSRLNPAAERAFEGVAAIEADDRERTVEIELRSPDRLFPYALATTWAAPVPRGTPARDLSRRPPPGIGPYRVAQVRRNGDVVLERLTRWSISAIPAGNPREIVTRTLPDLAQRVRAVRDGQADLVEGESPARILPDIRSEGENLYEEHRTLRSLYVSIDPSRAPFRDGDVRRAVGYALDARDLARILGGFMQPSCNALPPDVPGHSALDPCPFGDRARDADLIKASQLVRQAEADGSPVGVAAGRDRRGRALTRWMVTTLRKIGLRARAVPPARAEVAFASTDPQIPHPAAYLRSVDDPVLRARAELLEQEDDARDSAREWAELDRDVVTAAYVAPFGVQTAGVLGSSRLDLATCSRFHPVVGMDYSSVCVR
jgi:peptide/nickel transport system substrate-binding protein